MPAVPQVGQRLAQVITIRSLPVNSTGENIKDKCLVDHKGSLADSDILDQRGHLDRREGVGGPYRLGTLIRRGQP